MKEAEKASHTPEPWVVCNGHDIFTELGAINGSGYKAAYNDGWHIADCDVAVSLDDSEFNYRERAANARRIVLCVNACWDMGDDEIAQIMAESKGIGMRISQKEYAISELNRLIAETVQQREELLAALERIEKYGHGIGHRSGYTCANIAEEAIAKARGKS